MKTDKYEIVGTSLRDRGQQGAEAWSSTTGIAYNSTAKKGPVPGPQRPRQTPYRSSFRRRRQVRDGVRETDGADISSPAGSGLNASSVTPGAFTVSGNSVNSAFVVGQQRLPDPGGEPGS